MPSRVVGPPCGSSHIRVAAAILAERASKTRLRWVMGDKTAWRLSAVSKCMSLCDALSGQNVPRWRVIRRLRAREMMQSVRANVRRETESQWWVSGYQPHWYGWPSFSSDCEWHGSQSYWSAQDWKNWHEWQQSCESSDAPPRLYWHALD